MADIKNYFKQQQNKTSKMKEILCLGNDLANLHRSLMKFLFEIVVLVRKVICAKALAEKYRNIYLKYIALPNCDELKVK